MSADSRRWIRAIALFSLVSCAWPAAAGPQNDISPSVDGLGGAARTIAAGRCRDPHCRAELILNRAVELQIANVSATVGRPRPIGAGMSAPLTAALWRKAVPLRQPSAAPEPPCYPGSQNPAWSRMCSSRWPSSTWPPAWTRAGLTCTAPTRSCQPCRPLLRPGRLSMLRGCFVRRPRPTRSALPSRIDDRLPARPASQARQPARAACAGRLLTIFQSAQA